MTQPHPMTEAPRDPQTKPGRGTLAAFIFSLVVVQGLTINLMPVLFGPVARAFEVDLYQQGQLQSIFFAGGMIALLLSGYVTESIGAKQSGILAVSLIAAGSLLLGVATTYSAVLAGAFVMGLGNFWVVAAFSVVITVHFADVRQRMFMWTMAVFAGSATPSTALFGKLVDITPQWNLVFLALAALIGAWFAVFCFVFREKLRVISRPVPAEKAAEASPLGGLGALLQRAKVFLIGGVLNRWAFWVLSGLWALEALTVGSIITWTGRFFQMEYQVSDYQVGLVISASSAGVFVGRVLMGAFLSDRFSDRVVLGITFAGGMLLYALVLLIPSYPLGVTLTFFSGALLAAKAPTMYSLAAVKFGTRAAIVIPLMQAYGNLGGLVGPAMLGFLANHFGLWAVLWLIPVLGIVVVVIVFAWEIVDRRRAGTSLPSAGQLCAITPETGD